MDETSPQGHYLNYASSRQEFELREPTVRPLNWPVYLLTIALVVAIAIAYMSASGEPGSGKPKLGKLARTDSDPASITERAGEQPGGADATSGSCQFVQPRAPKVRNGSLAYQPGPARPRIAAAVGGVRTRPTVCPKIS